MFASLLLVALTALAPSGLDATVTGGDKPVLVLTNSGDSACQIVATATGTVAITRLEQDGKPVTPIPMSVAFPDGPRLEEHVRTLEPGASAEIPLQVIADVKGIGPALEMVTWSQTAGAYGALYPLQSGRSPTIELTYSIPIELEQPCPAAAASTATGAAQAGGRRVLLYAAAGIVVIGLLGVALFLLIRRRRRRGAVVVLLLAFGVTILPAQRADASYSVDPGLQSAFDECMAVFRAPGNDPAGILDDLDGDYQVQITSPAPGTRTGANVLRDPPLSIIYWDPEDRHPYHGSGGNADPCTSLYHELHHAWQGQQGIYSQEPCATSDSRGRTLERTEVLATHAQNLLRARLGLPLRDHYSDIPLPAECNPPEPPQRCSDSNCGDSNGDPHLLTFDHKRYDFQAVGEFVLARTAEPGYEVQVRQQPAARSRVVSVNTAVAMAVGPDKVEVRATPQGMVLLVGGAGAPLQDSRLPGGGKVSAGRDAVVVSWQDGPRAFLRPIGRWGLHVALEPVAAQAGKLEGLLGDFDGDSSNDIRPRGGTPITEPTFEALYPGFADSWRIDAATSLFTYDPGTGPESYVDKTFPDRAVRLDELPNRAAAEALCRAQGVTVPEVLAGCILDVALTGQADYASAAAIGQVLGGSDDSSGTRWNVSLTQPGQTATLEFAGNEGQKVFIDVPVTTLPSQCGGFTLRAPDGRQLATGCFINGKGHIDGTILPVTGTYTITIDPSGDRTGEARVRLIPISDQEGPITPDGPAVVARVDKPGVVGRFTFSGTAGQKIFIDVPWSTLPSQCGGLDLLDPAGRQIATGCTINGRGYIDAVVLPATGVYTVVVDPSERKTGDTTVRVVNAVDQKESLTLGGPAVQVRLRQPGAAAYLTFTGAAGQRVVATISGSTLPSQCGAVALRGPGGDVVRGGECVISGKGSLEVVLPASGTYTLVIDPTGRTFGDATVHVRT